MAEPRLRDDLQIADQAEGIVVKDPSRNKFYRFAGASALVLKNLDGTMDPGEISATLRRRANVNVSPESVRAFLVRLQEAGLLEGSERPAEESSGREILHYRFQAIDPRRAFDWLLPRTLFLFTPRFVYLSLALILAAGYISLTHSREMGRSLADLLTPSRLLAAVFIALIVGAIHEFAHGLASEHFGAPVPEMGFLLMFFQPYLYCDVSGSWILPKRQRLLVMLAGNWSTILVWALATLAWRILEPGTILSDTCVTAVLLSGVAIFANLNPLIKLDGYYMLSDILAIPNLRARAFNYLRSRMEGRPVTATAGQGLTFALYGVSAAVFSLALLGSVLWFAGGYMLSHLHLAGIVAVAGLVAVPAAALKKPDVLAVFATLLRTVAKKLRRFSRLLVLVVALAGLGMMPWELKVGGPFRILAERELTVAPQVDGHIAVMHIEEGNRVRRGQPIAILANPDLVRNAAKTRAELDAARARLALLRAGSRPEEVERLRAELARKELELAQARDPETERNRLKSVAERRSAELSYAKDSLTRARQLFGFGLIPRSELEREEQKLAVQQKLLDEARGALGVLLEAKSRQAELRQKEVQEARSQLDLIVAGPRPQEIQAAEAEARRQAAELAFLEEELHRTTVLSPADGVIATPYLKNRVGQFIRRGETLCKIVASSAETSIEISVPEREAADVAVGYPAALKLNSYVGGPTLAGRVAFIAPEIQSASVGNSARVECRVADSAGALKPGMTGFVKIYCGRRNVFQLATRRAMTWVRTEFWTWLP
jgi:multidrug resistance efflux pump